MAFTEAKLAYANTDAFKPVISGRLSKWAWWLVHKLGAAKVHRDPTQTYRKVVIDQDRMIDYVRRSMMEFERCYYRHPTQILIGPDAFAEIIGDRAMAEYYYYSQPVDLPITSRPLFGMQVKVVPHMTGVLVV